MWVYDLLARPEFVTLNVVHKVSLQNIEKGLVDALFNAYNSKGLIDNCTLENKKLLDLVHIEAARNNRCNEVVQYG